MPFQTPTGINPKKGSLIVSPGTITCESVSDMSSGFIVFKQYFNKNTHNEDRPGGWQAALQESLDSYYQKKAVMPAYVRIAKQDGFVGGIATVPVSGSRGLTFSQFSTAAEREKNFKEQYEGAIKQAVLDAKELKRPLFLQPLGIGVYGWDVQVAAELFAKAIVETDPKDELDITIPIFDSRPGSTDERFRTSFIAEMEKRGRKPQTEKSVVTQDKPKSMTELSPNKKILIDIVTTLIGNIENKKGGRWTSGINSKKVELLAELKNTIAAEKEEIETGNYVQITYLQEIMRVCQMKRNPLHFWSTPDSVEEYKQLLMEKKIELPTEQLAQNRN